MPTVEINGKSYDAIVGESLLGVGRTNTTHIGYFCGGNGLCQTCEVTIHSGEEALSDMNDVEKSWLTAQKIADGHRLACQAKIAKDGTVRIETRPNVFREKFRHAFIDKPAVPSPHPQGYIGEFFTYLGIETLAHLSAVPAVTANAVQRAMDGKLTTQAVSDSINAFSERTPEYGDAIAETTRGVANSITPILNLVGDILRTLPDALRPVGEAVSSVSKSLPEIFKPIGEAVDIATQNLPDALKSIADAGVKTTLVVTEVTLTTTKEVVKVISNATDSLDRDENPLPPPAL